MPKLLLLILLVVCLSSCQSQKKVLNSWMGHPKRELYMLWGPPSQTTDDGNGGEILIYANQVYAPQLNHNHWLYKMMYVNADGIIYHWRTSTQRVAPTQIDVRILSGY